LAPTFNEIGEQVGLVLDQDIVAMGREARSPEPVKSQLLPEFKPAGAPLPLAARAQIRQPPVSDGLSGATGATR
jgi:hypothetical protein